MARKYVPATWQTSNGGTQSTKVSGGYEVDRHGAPIPTRGLNRTDQRYALSATEAQARRTTRASAEQSATLVLADDMGTVIVHSPSGNFYQLSGDAGVCSCPDRFKLDASGLETVSCKHEIIATNVITARGGVANLDWSCRKLAEQIGCAAHTAQTFCEKGLVVATKTNGVWVIPHTTALEDFITAYQAKMIGAWPDLSQLGDFTWQ